MICAACGRWDTPDKAVCKDCGRDVGLKLLADQAREREVLWLQVNDLLTKNVRLEEKVRELEHRLWHAELAQRDAATLVRIKAIPTDPPQSSTEPSPRAPLPRGDDP